MALASPYLLANLGPSLSAGLVRFIQDTRGQDMIEYALIAASIGLGTLAGMNGLATSISHYLTDVADGFNSAMSGQA